MSGWQKIYMAKSQYRWFVVWVDICLSGKMSEMLGGETLRVQLMSVNMLVNLNYNLKCCNQCWANLSPKTVV